MRKWSLLLLLISVTGFSQNTTLEKRFDSVLSQYAKSDQPGLAGAVLQHGKLLYLKGLGVEDIETKKPITPQLDTTTQTSSSAGAAAAALW